eukprot:COSAG01_NODE_2876_length_6927_cov_482.724810_5_plen_527_part_00
MHDSGVWCVAETRRCRRLAASSSSRNGPLTPTPRPTITEKTCQRERYGASAAPLVSRWHQCRWCRDVTSAAAEEGSAMTAEPVWDGLPQCVVECEEFGTAGCAVYLYRLRSPNGLRVGVTTWGATVVSVCAPDRDGVVEEVTLNYRDLAGIRKQAAYYGATIGRVAGTIAGARYRADGKEFTLSANVNGVHHAHGGCAGFDKQVWDASVLSSPANGNSAAVRFTYTSIDGEEGYSGRVTASVTYTVTSSNELILEYSAETDKPTPVNMTNHTYWNLSGNCASTIHRHKLQVHAHRMQESPLDSARLVAVDAAAAPAFDLRSLGPATIGELMKQVPGGYDHVYVLDEPVPPESPGPGAQPEANAAAAVSRRHIRPSEPSRIGPGHDGLPEKTRFGSSQMKNAALLVDEVSGRAMSVATNQPCLVVYTANFLPRRPKGRKTNRRRSATYDRADDAAAMAHRRHGAVCLETLGFIGSLRFKSLPGMMLRPSQCYHHRTVHKFFSVPLARAAVQQQQQRPGKNSITKARL